MSDLHFEPYIHLAGLTHAAALIAWGGFYFSTDNRHKHQPWLLVDDENLDAAQPTRTDSIGERSRAYGEALVEVADCAGRVVARARTQDVNHAWLGGLLADTEYSYRITVDGRPWAAGERYDWIVDASGASGLRQVGRSYCNRFRTFPHPSEQAPLACVILGDFGVGVRGHGATARRQRALAAALEQVVDAHDVRLILTTGDNIYSSDQREDDSGDEDDDWFFPFYQPYRYVLNRIPFFPTVGNHDSSDTEKSDDRAQLYDNYFLAQRFETQAPGEDRRASTDPGLFYTFGYGADVRFLCIDTTLDEDEQKRFFELPKHRDFIARALSTNGPSWRIPFCHHPPYCAGPHHDNMEAMIDRLVPLFEQSGVRAVFSGHEHNYQHSQANGIHYFITGAGGKLRCEPPTHFAAANTRAWATEGHFLLVEIDGQRMVVTPFGECSNRDELVHLPLTSPAGAPVITPTIIPRGS